MFFPNISNTKRLLVLLGVIFAILILPPFLDLVLETHLFFDVLSTAILIATVFALNNNKPYVIISSLLVIPLLLAIWVGRVYGQAWPIIPGFICGIIFFAFTAFHILKLVLTREEVTKQVIAGAVAVYLMLGFICSFFYGLIDILAPGSFAYNVTDKAVDAYTYIYYSFITLTTLGYGDIVPVTPLAQCIALTEAIVGQLYLVVLVAWLVGMYISDSRVKKQTPSGGQDNP